MKKVSKAAPEILRYSSGRSQVSNWDFLFERSTLDDRYYPRKGTFHSLEWDVAAKRMASNYSFNRITWQSRGYWTPGNFFTFMARTKVGWIESYGKTSMVPYFERFFCGGSSTIRGYRSRKVGPKDSDNLPLGGDFLWVNNFEARFPIFKKLTGACFFDAGSLWQDTGALHWNDMRYGTGVGLRYISPWGIIRADYGIRLRHDSSQPRSAYYLSFGMPF
jgi:outer membrane protein assembly factor BamA